MHKFKLLLGLFLFVLLFLVIAVTPADRIIQKTNLSVVSKAIINATSVKWFRNSFSFSRP